MPEVILPQRRSWPKLLLSSFFDLPLFWYRRVPLRSFYLPGRPVWVLPLLLFWLALPPFLIFFSFRDSRALLPLAVILVVVWWWALCHPRYQLSEVKDRPLIKIDEIAARKVLAVRDLDSNQFLSLAPRLPRVENLLRRAEVELPLKFSSPPLKIFRDRRVWEIAFREALETRADYLRTDHLFFGALAFEEMQNVLTQINIRIEDLRDILVWVYQMERWRRRQHFEDGQPLETLKFAAWQLERDHEITVSYPALTTAIKLSAQFFPDQVLPDKAANLLNEAAASVRKAGRDFVGSEDVMRLVSEKVKIPLSWKHCR